jgi:hypothetical protein
MAATLVRLNWIRIEADREYIRKVDKSRRHVRAERSRCMTRMGLRHTSLRRPAMLRIFSFYLRTWPILLFSLRDRLGPAHFFGLWVAFALSGSF